MKKIIIAFLLFSLLLPLTLSAPSATVLSPNGGEILSGTSTIIFNAQHTDWVNAFDANIYLSFNTAGLFDAGKVIDVNLLDSNVCNFGTTSLLVQKDDFSTFTSPDAVEEIWGKPSIFYHENKFRMIVGVGTSTAIDPISYTYNTVSDEWEYDGDYNAGLIVDTSEERTLNRDGEIIDIGGEIYMLYGTAIGTTTQAIGWKYNGTSNEWERNFDINSGIQQAYSQFHAIHPHSFEFEGENWLIILDTYNGEAQGAVPVTKSYKWNSITTTWARASLFEPDFQLLKPIPTGSEHYATWGTTVFVKDEIVYKLEAPWDDAGLTAHDGETVAGLVFINGSWEVSDINIGITGASNQWTYDVIEWEDQTILFRFADFLGGTEFDSMEDFIWDSEAFDTKAKAFCQVSFDTTSFQNRSYFLDLNIFDNVGGLNVDSSDGVFNIINWDNSDISCECISNCFSCILDVNTFEVIPLEENNDVEIKITNETGLKNIGVRINNTLTNDKQYFINTSGNGTTFSFNDTATYGSTVSNGVQKIWKPVDEGTSFFEHSFIDIIQSDETKYYNLKFRSPMFSWASMKDNPDWDVSFIPQKTDLNGHFVDEYQVSSYSNIRNELIESIPNISGSSNSGNYVFQLNAKVNSSTGTILAGEVNSKGENPTTTSTILTKEIRYNYSTISKGILSMISNETTSRLYTVSDYALVQRGFFTRGFDILDKHSGTLELYVDDSNNVRNFLVEGQQFKVKGQLYDRDNTIDFIEVTAFLETDSDSNKVLYKKIEIGDETTQTEQFIDYDIDLEGIFDLTANTLSYRDLLIKIKVTDEDLNYSEVQHDWIKLRQFPFLPGDLFLGIDLINKLKSEHPAGRITLKSDYPEAIRGLNFRFLTSPTELPNSDYNATLYKGIDFDCIGEDCSFDFEIDDWIFPKYGFWRFTVSVLLTTQEEDLNNSRTTKTLHFYVNFKEFKMAKIVETRERSSHDYKPTERIPLVLVLQDSDGADLSNQLNVFLTVEDCNSSDEELGIEAAFGCWAQTDINYSWKEHLYDETTGINYYFFESVMVKNFNTTFSDANFMRVVGHVQDAKNQHVDSDFNPLLATKCKTNVSTNCHALDVFCFLGSALTSALEYGLGCLTENGKIITFDTNGSQEGRIDWDSTKTPGAPNLECFGCMNADNNNVYRNNLEQDLLCGGWYTLGEQSVDKLVFRVGNEFSDYSEHDDDLKQYLEMDIPYSTIYYNDPVLLKKGLELKFSTGTCASIGTLGELIWCGLNDLFTGIGNPLSDVFSGATSTGFITNIGSDCNFNNAFDPNFLDGVFFVKVDGLKVTNVVDYLDVDESIKDSDPSRFFKTLRDLEIEKKQETTQITFFGNNHQEFKKETVQSNLVIDEKYTDLDIIEGNIDPDSVLPNFKTIPSILKFTIISDLIYADETIYIRRAVPIFITTSITPQFGGADAIRRRIGKGINEFIENPADTLLIIPFDTIFNLDWWAGGGWFWIFLIVVIIVMLALFRGRPQQDQGS